MTEITGNTNPLPAAAERFVLQWGEMGTSWGVNRSVAQIHALLYLSEKPLNADEIAETLTMARSNVSNSLKELLSWRIARRVHVMGDRRDFFVAEADLWELLSLIAAGRKAREIDPAIDMLRICVAEGRNDKAMSPEANDRLSDLLNFVEMLDAWYGQMSKLPRSKTKAIIKMGAAIARFAGAGKGRKARSATPDDVVE